MQIRLRKQSSRGRTMGVGALLLMVGALGFSPGEAQAQLGFAAEGRVGVTFPQGDLSDAGAEAGLGLGAELQANFHPRATVYAGVYRHQFRCEDDCLFSEDPTSTGLSAGIKYIVHNPGDVLVWGRGGLVYNTLDVGDSSTDRELGFEVGVGADMSIATRTYLVPHLGYVSHAAGSSFTASFFTFGVGLHYHIN
jgi:hypothetical protein